MMPKKAKKPQSELNNLLLPVVLALLIAFPFGYALGNANSDDTEDKDSSHSADKEDSTHVHDDSHSHDDGTTHKTHTHMTYDASELANPPEVTSLTVLQDSKSGWNVSFETENFEFTPENVNEDNVDGEGHAHLYVDGEKVTRLYSHNYYLSELSAGQHEVMVTLNTNMHEDYSVDGELVSFVTMITVGD